MAHKRNPISFESAEGLWRMISGFYQGVFNCLISDHQRDLVGSSEMRNFPAIVVLCQQQIERMNRTLPKITIDQEALLKNFNLAKNLIMAEPIYLALQMYGYEKDAHELVNHTLVPRAKESGDDLITELIILAQEENEIEEVLSRIPEEILDILSEPSLYIGKAAIKTMEVVGAAKIFLEKYKTE